MSRCARFQHARWLPPAALSLLGLLLLSERLPAQVEFTECPNLVMRPRGGANWDGTHTFCPTVTQIDGRYYMWYTGVNGPLALGLAESGGDPCSFTPPDVGFFQNIWNVQCPGVLPVIDDGELRVSSRSRSLCCEKVASKS